ncbi:ComF family protein [Humitalea rosea]|uniref:ComF family protein n=1 Tax=Humitalea rosea TaxID=990373 RepID=A0A2W7IHX5_9PROT|nr:ComF family protein [Humitalea rosea]PZW44725.1 ComF family protein [Humitalea rosea]
MIVQAARGHLGGALRFLLDALLPPHCPACGGAVATQGLLCSICVGDLTTLGAPLCARCASPFRHAGQAAGQDAAGGLVCEPCLRRPPAFTATAAAFRYDEGVKRLVLPLKHGDRPEMARVLAGRMILAGRRILATADLLVPVPLHPARLRQRRYNQSALLAARIARGSGVAWHPDLLRRVRATPSLADRGAAERALLVAEVFRLRPGARLHGKHIVLIDDVMTSGATASACAAVLLEGGAGRVSALVAARVPNPSFWAG